MRRAMCVVGLGVTFACSSNSPGPGQTQSDVTAPTNRYPNAPPNAPAPPAACGDMNGGGDQHVDFAALMAQKVAEKPEVTLRQQTLLADRYDLRDDPHPDVHMSGGK